MKLKLNQFDSPLFRFKIFLICIIFTFVILIVRSLFIFDNKLVANISAKLIKKKKINNINKQKENKENEFLFNRLNIIDRNNNIIARNIMIYDFYLIPFKMIDFKKDLNKISQIVNLDKDKSHLIEALEQKKHKDHGMVLIKKGISEEQKNLLLKNGVLGLSFIESEKRYYPYNNLFYHITGLSSYENQGLFGIEKEMNSYLKHTINKKPLELSMDANIQEITRNVIHKAFEDTQSKGAVALIMNINNGELISAVSLPDCDANNFNECSKDSYFNKFSLGVYELGSIFKLFLAALAYEQGFSPEKKYKREAYKIGNFTIHDIDKKDREGGELSILDIIKKSSNVGCAKVVEEIGAKKQYEFFKKLNLFQKVNIELPEVGKPIYNKKPSLINAVTMSYGHGIAVTPLHYVSALASILANKNIYPTLFKYDNQYKLNTETLVKQETIDKLKFTMQEVIKSGGGKVAYLNEYEIGGKSGTAIKQINGKYDRHKLTLSFVATIPVQKPEYIIFLMLDEPNVNAANNYYYRASTVLGPVMKDLVSIVAPILNVEYVKNNID